MRLPIELAVHDPDVIADAPNVIARCATCACTVSGVSEVQHILAGPRTRSSALLIASNAQPKPFL